MVTDHREKKKKLKVNMTMNTGEATTQNNAATDKGKAKKAVLLSLGTLALGTLAFFGIKHLKKQKNESNDNSDQTTDNLDTKIPVQTHTNSLPRTSVRPANAGNAFPLNLGAKGNKVLELQQSLVRTFGASIFPKYGADGVFGTELADFLRNKGYGVPLSEAEFKKITQTQTTTQTPLTIFDPTSIALGIYKAIVAKDFNSVITLLKAITNTKNYSLVSEKFKNYRVNGGVRQTLVTALFKSFPEKSQTEATKQVFLKMGLKYNEATDKWSI
ncbi:hypothetical protein CNR22_13515 [Sphingobacteriaceae bacterium]|nr:hypothetical protein CNR22_13515 [Sphingobacteriaceae bacterium]